MIEQMLDRLIAREGGFVNNPIDRGGPTKYGITQNTLNSYQAHDPTAPTVVQFLSKLDARKIYKTMYWEKTNVRKIKNQFIAEMVLDQCVNCGPSNAIRRLQASINFVSRDRDRNISEDGIIGPVTIKAIDYSPPRALALSFFRLSQMHYIKICIGDPSQTIFLKGWMNRSYQLLELAVRANSAR